MSQQTTYKYPWLNQFMKATGFILVVLYLLNCFTPLRMHYDMIRYFGIEECILNGCPPDSASAQDYLPYGYTGLLIVLSKLGILKSFTIVLVNCIYLFAGLYLIRKIFAASLRPFIFSILVLLNWAVMKFTVHPLSEIQFFFFSTLSLYFFYQHLQQKKFIPLALAFVFAGFAFLTRTIGVALVPALLLGLCWEHKKQLSNIVRKNKVLVLIIALLVAGVFIFSKQLGLNHYTGVRSEQFKGNLTTMDILGWHFKEWTEVILNVPFNRIEMYLGKPTLSIFIILGIIFVGWFVYILLRSNNFPFFIKIYLLAYCAIIFYWPFYDPRFWVPIIPMGTVVMLQTPVELKKITRMVRPPLFFVYTILGIFALAYLTYTSFNKKVFSKTQASGVYRNEYETFFYGKPISDTTTQKNDEFVVHLLQKYN
ncbi:MAG: hypothetical protein JST75_01655 [Bacteroidetes bacterium]|nr:hypothetical protein [Bacteroidota bacterium]